MNGSEARAFLEGLSPSVIRLGLDRMQAALRTLGNPERDFPAVHVAGTNGKGSTSAFIASMLAAQGFRVGLYTSPHLETVHERIRISDEQGLTPISDEALAQRVSEVLERFPQARETPSPLSYFEFGTLVAFWHFSREEVDVAVIETGLGGRLDATSCCQPEMTAITPIAFDHTELLGNTLQAIAREKAGIFKAGIPAVLARQTPEAQGSLETRARELGVPLVLEGLDFSMSSDRGVLTYRGPVFSLAHLRLGLRGEHQWQNAAVAIAAVGQLASRGFKVRPEAVREGLERTRWPGRLEEVGGHPTVLLDGAHNPQGMTALVRALETEFAGRPLHAIFGVLGDKDVRPMIRLLFPRCASVRLVAPPSPRALAPASYLEEARGLCPDVSVSPDLPAALQAATSQAGDDGLVLACGSLVLVGAMRAAVRGASARS